MRYFDWPAVSEFHFTSRTPEEACARSEQGDRARRGEADTPLLRGWVFRNAIWSDSQILLRFEDEKSLLVWVDAGGRIEWAFPAQPDPWSPEHQSGAAPVEISLDGLERVWDASGVLAARAGQVLKGVRPGKVWLRVYIGDMNPLWFWAFVERGTGTWFLYWNDEDSD